MRTPNVTSLQASVGGPSPCAWPAGLTAALCGQVAALASLSPRRAKDWGLLTPATSGPPSAGSLASAALQSSLESRLRQRLDGLGSPLYALTWRHWPTPSGAPICALRASGRRTSDSGCSGWATPAARDHKGATLDRWGDNSRPLNEQVRWIIHGPLSNGSSAATAKPGQVNPAFSRWLMGYLTEWDACAATVTPSSRKLRRSSSARTSTPGAEA